ncbi:MAG TPA: T9SS type A sorting domain-containing protein, partial [Chitinophagaceae bacterium]|nr:T9SS type A sorting domain-containing protein [Chitinophagaceae bacterium]
ISANTYSDNALANTDVVSCVLMSSIACVSNATDTSNLITMIVNPTLTPSVSISVSPSDTLCVGANATFTSAVTNPGTSVSYLWKKNGVTTLSTASTFTTNGLSNGDVVTLIISTAPLCASATSDTSNAITMTLLNNVTPTVSITASPSNTICTGTSVTFTATTTFGGTAPIYQWTKNGNPVGINSTTYTDAGLLNGDIIICNMTSNESCAAILNVVSNSIAMSVNAFVTPTVSITASPGTTICDGTQVSFTASQTNGGISPQYQWKKNGLNVGSNSNTYVATGLLNGDIITCVMTSNYACATTTIATSNSLTLNVLPTTLPTISISANPGTVINAGQSVTFTASATNAGATPVYQWQVNASNVGSNSPTYTSSTLTNGDDITCILTSSDACPVPASVTSNNLKMTITVGLNQVNSLLSTFNYFPNPAKDMLQLQGHLSQVNIQALHCEIVNAVGQVLLTQTINTPNGELDATLQLPASCASGWYVLKIAAEGHTQTYRFMVDRHD